MKLMLWLTAAVFVSTLVVALTWPSFSPTYTSCAYASLVGVALVRLWAKDRTIKALRDVAYRQQQALENISRHIREYS